MNLTKITVLLILLSFTVSCQNEKPKELTKDDLKTEEAKVSYALGIDLGKNIKLQGVDVDVDVFVAALKTSLLEKEALLTEEEITNTILAYHTKKRAENDAKKSADIITNKAAGEKFLTENKTKKDVKTTASGLQYMVIRNTEGPKPSATNQVKVNYIGTLIDGTEFDNSYNRGEPITFPLNRVIPGWTEGLQLMSIGSKYKFFIPYELAYGENGKPPVIPPASTLIFEVELLEIL